MSHSDTADGNEFANMDRRTFLKTAGVGAAGLAAVGTGLLGTESAEALMMPSNGSGLLTPGVTPTNASSIGRLPLYNGPWNKIHPKPFAGFNFALGYIAEGIDEGDPVQEGPNPSGLFETFRDDIPSGVGGNETQARSAEYWYKDILGWSNETIVNDFWSAINWARRMWGVDLDDPNTDGYNGFAYPGSPDPNDEVSIWSPRIAIDGNGGLVRMAPTLLAPSVGYTVVFRAGHSQPNYSDGTTAMFPEDVGKVRDGGVWGGTVESMDVLPTIQAVAAGDREYTTPTGVSSAPAHWGQWWRRVEHLEPGLDINTMAVVPVDERPEPRTAWPVGYLPKGTDFFWGNYNLKMGTNEPTITLHYESQVPTRFRDFDGIPEAFICELTAHPGGTDMPESQIEQGFKDLDGSMSGFADLNDPELNGQNQFGIGRVHGTSYPRGRTADGRATFHLRNWLLFPPRLNSAYTINTTVPGKGPLEF